MYIELFEHSTPRTVKNFVGLALGTKAFKHPQNKNKIKKKFYDDLTFHLLSPNHILQGGDPLGTGQGGPGYTFGNEINAESLNLHQTRVGDTKNFFGHEIQTLVLRELGIRTQADFSREIRAYQKQLRKYNRLTVKQLLQKMGYQFTSPLPSLGNLKYTLAMANRGPKTNGSQFFINLRDNSYKNGRYTVFGRIVKGDSIIEKIEQVERRKKDNRPVHPVRIKETVLLK